MSHRDLSGEELYNERLKLWQYECDMITSTPPREPDIRDTLRRPLTAGDRSYISYALSMVAYHAERLDPTPEVEIMGHLLQVITKLSGVDARSLCFMADPVNAEHQRKEHQLRLIEATRTAPATLAFPSRHTTAGRWQSMQSAPMDGTEILLKTTDGVISGFWEVEHNTPGQDDGFEGWVAYSGDYVFSTEDLLAWQPLPEGTLEQNERHTHDNTVRDPSGTLDSRSRDYPQEYQCGITE